MTHLTPSFKADALLLLVLLKSVTSVGGVVLSLSSLFLPSSVLSVDCALGTGWSHRRPWDCICSAESWDGGDSYTQL